MTASDQEIDSGLVADGHVWMARLRLPYWTIAKIREMHVGDELSLFSFVGPPMVRAGSPLGAYASITKEKGGYRFDALWMLHVGHVERRGHIWSWVHFRLEKHSVIRFSVKDRGGDTPEDALAGVQRAEYQVRRICRLVARLRRMAERAGDRASMVKMLARPEPSEMCMDHPVAFLDTLAAPMFGRNEGLGAVP